jgi:imidazolonepropionase
VSLSITGHLTIEGDRIAAMDGGDPRSLRQVDPSGGAVVPGFVDCHTHLPFAGWRADEYEQKVAGVPYEEIARSGGGIASSASAFETASDDEILTQAWGIADEMLQHGTTTLELKTGYGLSVAGERRQLALAHELAGRIDQTARITGLFAHAVPPGMDADAWLDQVERELLPSAEVDALDIYVESVAFTNEQLRRVGRMAAARGVALRAHVEQFNANRSVPVALECGARSVDHLARLHPDDIAALAKADCAAVLLPGAEFLGDESVAPGRALLDAGARCVLATDCNPGTSPVSSLPLVMGLAVRRYGWTAAEALRAVTEDAAWVLGLDGELGSLEAGKRADVLVLDGPIEHIPYRLGHNPVAVVIIGGQVAWVRPDQEWRIR